jgi:lycopene cyclase domain-containing protein
MKTEYLIVLGAILFFPLFFSIVMRLRMYAHPRALISSIAFVCLIYWVWDIIVTARGHWSFNPAYILGIQFIGMPLEEWLFFIVIGFVSIFTYEAVRFVISRKDRE